jgi:hypothetical protein
MSPFSMGLAALMAPFGLESPKKFRELSASSDSSDIALGQGARGSLSSLMNFQWTGDAK